MIRYPEKFTAADSSVSSGEQEIKSLGIHCEFKPAAGTRAIEYISDEDADEACQWVMKKYASVLRELAK